MKKEVITKLHSDFEHIVKVEDETGVEFWLARDLQNLLGYAKWENFVKVVSKEKTSCITAGYDADDHFLDVRKMVTLGSGAQREIADVALTRYACYLIAQNGDPSKEEIAFAQTYFAVQTRKQELIEKALYGFQTAHDDGRIYWIFWSAAATLPQSLPESVGPEVVAGLARGYLPAAALDLAIHRSQTRSCGEGKAPSPRRE